MTDFAVYRGEDLLVVGTAAECAKLLNVKPETVKYYATPTWARRYETRKKPEKCLIAVRLTDQLYENMKGGERDGERNERKENATRNRKRPSR